MATHSVTAGVFAAMFSDLPLTRVKKKIDDLQAKECGFFGPAKKWQKEIITMETMEQHHGSEKEGEITEKVSLRDLVKTGSIREWAETINGYVRSAAEAGNLTEENCRSLDLLIGDLCEREDFSEDDEKHLSEITSGLMKDIPLYAYASLLDLLALQMHRDEVNVNLVTGALLVLRKRGYSFKEIKRSVNKFLPVEKRKRFGKLLSEIKDNVENYMVLDKETDRIAEQLSFLENDPWTEEEAVAEAVEGMSWATEMLLRDGHLDSSAYLYKKGAQIVYPLIFNCDRAKARSLQALQMLVSKVRPDAVIVFAETWVGSKGREMRPSEDPHRTEGILVSVETPLGIWHGFQFFRRDESSKIALERLIAPEKTKSEGRFVFMHHGEEKVQCNA